MGNELDFMKQQIGYVEVAKDIFNILGLVAQRERLLSIMNNPKQLESDVTEIETQVNIILKRLKDKHGLEPDDVKELMKDVTP